MCLSSCSLPENRQVQFLQQAKKRGYFRVYKVVIKYFDGCKLTGPNYGKRYRAGARSTKGPGWHVFLDRKTAKTYVQNSLVKKLVVCYAKIGWLKKLAYQFCTSDEAATFHTLVFPDFDKGDMTIREFRAACKKQK